MPTLNKIIDDLGYLSSQLSSQTRTLSLGLLIIVWGLIFTTPKSIPQVDTILTPLLIIGILCVISMALDFGQYLVGYINTNRLREKMEREGLEIIKYDETAILYRLRTWFFWGKQTSLALAVILFIAAVVKLIIINKLA